MLNPTMRITLGALSIWGASFCWAASESSVAGSSANPLAEPALSAPVEPAAKKAASQADGAATQAAAKPILGEAFIAQNQLQVYLNRPAAIFVYNARGQQIFHSDSQASMESVPLLGVNSGFLYLTVRAGQTELTKKLVYTGK